MRQRRHYAIIPMLGMMMAMPSSEAAAEPCNPPGRRPPLMCGVNGIRYECEPCPPSSSEKAGAGEWEDLRRRAEEYRARAEEQRASDPGGSLEGYDKALEVYRETIDAYREGQAAARDSRAGEQ